MAGHASCKRGNLRSVDYKGDRALKTFFLGVLITSPVRFFFLCFVISFYYICNQLRITNLFSNQMRKSLLLLAGFLACLPSFAINEFYYWAGRFDNLNLNESFPVLSETGDTLKDASAVVVEDPSDPSNKVLHVVTGSTPGFVLMDTPEGLTPSNLVNKYTCVSMNVMRAGTNEATASSKFKLFFTTFLSYQSTAAFALEADTWTGKCFSPLTARSSMPRKKNFMFGLDVANADYYIDDICFMSSPDAFEKEKAAIEKARQDSIRAIENAKRDSILRAELVIRDSIMQEQSDAYDRMISEINSNMDRELHYDFEDFEVGTTFPVYSKSGSTQIAGATATVELDGNNKVLHVCTPEEGGYVQLDIIHSYSPSNFLNKYVEMCIQIRRSAGNTATASTNFEVVLGSYNAVNASFQSQAGNWTTQTFKFSNSGTSTQLGRKKVMKIGLVAAGADYYIDNIYYPQKEYDATFSDPTKTARYWADQIGKNFGTCLNQWTASSQGQIAGKNFNMVVCENEMKFDATEPQRNQFSYNGGQAVVNVAKQYNMKVRGHTLTWHGQNPNWVSNFSGSRKDWEQILKNHIYNVVGHWKGQIAEWDVVNECLEENNGCQEGGGYQTRTWSAWYKGFGDDSYIDSAFVWAHQADPDAKLYINDYNIGAWDGGPTWENGKTHAMYNLAKRLKDAGIPIDGVGMQTHINLNSVDPAQIEKTVKKFRAIGLNCIITEMDLPGGQVSGSGDNAKLVRGISEKELQIQAEKYAAITDIMIRYDNCPSMVVWGVTDDRSWLDCSEGTKPLLFFADNTPHPAYIEVRRTYQRWAEVITEVDDIFADDSDDDMIWYDSAEKTVDVYNLLGQKVAAGITSDQIMELPDGFYIIGGKKVLIRE